MICKSCKSDRCGNHAACERRMAALREWDHAGTLLWLIVGIAEHTAQNIIRRTPRVLLIAAGGPEAVRRECAIGVMQSIELRTRPSK